MANFTNGMKKKNKREGMKFPPIHQVRGHSTTVSSISPIVCPIYVINGGTRIAGQIEN